MDYSRQLFFKQKQVTDSYDRIGKFPYPEVSPIIPSPDIFHYRNKLEYTFSSRKWFMEKRPEGMEMQESRALGFHLPGMFDRIIDIDRCFLQDDLSNRIRLLVKSLALESDLSFYDARNWQGFLRNLILRNTTTGRWMVIVVFGEDEPEIIKKLLSSIRDSVPEIASLMYVINTKHNDDISDLEIRLFHGEPYIIEEIPAFLQGQAPLRFKVGPVSFFQTNTRQAARLYQIAAGFAGFRGDELVYDLYSGTGTIGCYIASSVKKVIGLEYVQPAVDDARENARINGLENISFFAGDIARVMDPLFFDTNGIPDVIITDPPRAGMHEKVVRQILSTAPGKIVYVSCNPATQARDIALLAEKYRIGAVQPVDMFPHTQHVECVTLLEKDPAKT
jgi:23S rRNA (uracil1939-C5)-methyltransferase